MKERQLRIPISLEIFLLSVIPLVIVATVVSFMFFSTTTRNIEEQTAKLAVTTTEKLSEEISKTMAPFRGKVQDMNALANYNHDAQFLGTVVRAMGTNAPEGFSIYYATEISRFEEGGIFEESGGWTPEPDWQPQTRPWYKIALDNPDQICFVDPYIDSRTGKVCVTISHSVTDSTEKIVGVTGIDLSLETVASLIENYKISDTGTIHLLDKNGTYITHSDNSKIMSENFFSEYKILQRNQQQFMDGSSHAIINSGQYFAIAPVEGTPWFVVALGNVSDFTSTVLSTISVILLIIGVQVVVVLIASLIFSRLISKTFSSMVDHCNKFSEGDFTAHFSSYIIQEADSLAKGFEAFSQNIRMLVGKIFKSASSVSEMSTSLATTASTINKSVNDTVEAISQMASTSSKQTVAVQQVDEAVHVIVEETNRLNQEIDSQNNIISSSSSSIEEIVQGMSNVQSDIASTANDMEELVTLASNNKSSLTTAAQEIVSVRHESASLQEMNSVISSVAAQTNLLAMNAAIEAAHAGAAGKGFAVVADEIRKLAETASKQASSSSSYLKSIQGKIDAIAETAVGIDKSFETTIQRIRDICQVVIQLEQTTSEQGNRSAQVLRALDDIRTSTNNITMNVEAITNSTARTSQLCRTLREMNSNVNDGITSCKTASVSMKESSDLVNSVASATRQSVSELLEAVGSFRVERRAPQSTGQDSYKGPDRRQQNVSLVPPKLS